MVEVFRVNAWVVTQKTDGYLIQNIDKNYICEWNRVLQRYVRHNKKFNVPITIQRVIEAREQAGLYRNYISSLDLSGRTYGIEIECYHPTDTNIRTKVSEALTEAGIPCRSLGYTHQVLPTWKIVTDGSIRGGCGLEVVSPVLSGEQGLEQIKKVTKILSDLGCRVNRSTGLHVHHGAQDLTESHILKIFKLYKDNEELFDSLVAPSRRDSVNQYCRSLKDYTGIPSTRYTKVNYQSFIKYGTLEIRHHQGSLNAEKIINWIRLTQRLVERAENYTREFPRLDEMIRFMGLDEIESWFLERAEELSA